MNRLARQTAITLFAVAGLLLSGTSAAQSYSGESRIKRWYLGGGFGAFAEKDNAQLADQDTNAALFVSAGYRASANIALEADFLGWKQDFLTPAGISPGILGSADTRTDLESSGLGAVIKFIAPLRAVDLYGGGGMGYYAVNLSVAGTGASAGQSVDKTERDLGYQLLAGADIYISRNISVGLEYRWLKLDVKFEPMISGEVDAGGQFLLMNFRGHF